MAPMDTIKARISEVLTRLNTGVKATDLPEIDWEATRLFEDGGERVLVVGDGYVLRRTGPNPTVRGQFGDIPWPADYPDGLWYDANETV